MEPHLSELTSEAASGGQSGATSLGVVEETVRAAQEPEDELPRPAVVALWLFARIGLERDRSSIHLGLHVPLRLQSSSLEAPSGRRAGALGISSTAESFWSHCGRDAVEADLCGRDVAEADLEILRPSPRLHDRGSCGFGP